MCQVKIFIRLHFSILQKPTLTISLPFIDGRGVYKSVFPTSLYPVIDLSLFPVSPQINDYGKNIKILSSTHSHKYTLSSLCLDLFLSNPC